MDVVLANLFMKILNMSITAAYVTLFVCIIRLFLRRLPKSISYALWSVVFIRLVCPVSFQSAYSILNTLRRWNIPTSPSGLAFVPDKITALQTAPDYLPQATSTIAESLPAVAAGAPAVSLFVLAAAFIWLAGIAAMLIYGTTTYLKLKRSLSDATLIQGRIFETDTVTSPFIFGFFRPRIILPVGIVPEDAAYVLSHEQTHIRRRDYLIKPLAFLVLAINWFNPFIWQAYFLMGQDMEMSCDEAVMKRLGQQARSDYSSTLLRLSLHRRSLALSPLAFGESGTKSRVRNILNFKKPAFWISVVAIAAVITIGICLLANPQNPDPSYKPRAESTLPQNVTVKPESSGYPAGTNEIRLIIQNQSGTAIQYGSRYAIEKYDEKKDTWRHVPFAKNAAFDGLLHNLENQGTASFYIYLSMLQDKTAAGKYRVWLLDDRITCEFELTNETLTSTETLPKDITLTAWSGGQVVQGMVITETYQKRIILDAIMEHSLQSTAYPGISRDQMGSYISIQIADRELYPNDFYLFSQDGHQYLQNGLMGMYSELSFKTYDQLISVFSYEGMIGLNGLPLDYTMTVQSGASRCLAMAHMISSYDKQSKLTDSMAPVTPQAVADKLQWLEIDFNSEKDMPFTPFVKGLKVYGQYTVYDSNFEKIPYFLPSGLQPQTYLFQNAAKPGQYIVELETSFETDDSTFTCQYFFGVYLPDPASTGTPTPTSPAIQGDPVSGYLFVVDYLANEQDFDRRKLKYLAVDTTRLAGLTAADKTRFLQGLEKYNLQVLDKTKDELIADGYIQGAGGQFTDGALIIMDKISIKEKTMTMDAFVYFGGLEGFGLLDFDITFNGSWSITRTEITVQA